MLERYKSGMVGPDALAGPAIKIFEKHFKYIVLIGLGIYLPVGLVMELLAGQFNFFAVYQTRNFSGFFPPLAMLALVTAAVLSLETAALTYFARQKLNDEDATPLGIMEAAFGNWSKLFITALIYLVIVSLGLMLIVPGIIFGVFARFCLNIVVVENVSGAEALRRSAAIVKGRWLRTACVLALLWLIELIPKTIIAIGLSTVWIFLEALTGTQGAASEAITAGNPGILFHGFSIFASAIAEVICILFRLAGALYFFNLYYTSEPKAESL
ncbi:MAG: hypothetical protein FWE68_03910 [Defluviitaleaceae bacterium]|nr:hypothetical protein [Defluviitaleaceae bacterium]